MTPETIKREHDDDTCGCRKHGGEKRCWVGVLLDALADSEKARKESEESLVLVRDISQGRYEWAKRTEVALDAARREVEALRGAADALADAVEANLRSKNWWPGLGTGRGAALNAYRKVALAPAPGGGECECPFPPEPHPRGVHLVSTRPLTDAEKARGAALEDKAQEVLARDKPAPDEAGEIDRSLTLIDDLASMVVGLSPGHAESTLVLKAREIVDTAKREAKAAAEGYEKALGLVAEAIGKRWPGALVVSDKEASDGRATRIGGPEGRNLHICFLPAGELRAAHIESIKAMHPIEDSVDIVTMVHSVEATREYFPHLEAPAEGESDATGPRKDSPNSSATCNSKTCR